MTTLVDLVPVDRDDVFKGAAMIASRVSTTVPTKLEDLINLTSFAIASGFVDLGGTSEDGVTITRTASLTDGIKVDQRKVALDKGEPETWEMSLACNLIDTTYASLVSALQYGTVTALGAQGGQVAQHQVSVDAPAAFTEKQFVVFQQDVKSLRTRAWWFRKAIPAVDGEMALKSADPTTVPFKLTINTDSTVAEGSGQFGLYFEED